MNNAEFYSFMEGINELVKTKKPNERIVVDVYNSYGRKLNDDDEI